MLPAFGMALFALPFLGIAAMSARWRQSNSSRHLAGRLGTSGRTDDDWRAINREVFTVSFWWALAVAAVIGLTAAAASGGGSEDVPWYGLVPLLVVGLAGGFHVDKTLRRVAADHGGWVD